VPDLYVLLSATLRVKLALVIDPLPEPQVKVQLDPLVFPPETDVDKLPDASTEPPIEILPVSPPAQLPAKIILPPFELRFESGLPLDLVTLLDVSWLTVAATVKVTVVF